MITRIAIACIALSVHSYGHAQQISWQLLGRQADVRYEWSSNVLDRDATTISTYMRLVYDKEDRAPNNATFDNKRIGVQIRCAEKTYFILGQSYHKGERMVLSESLSTIGGFEPYADTFVEKIATRVCG